MTQQLICSGLAVLVLMPLLLTGRGRPSQIPPRVRLKVREGDPAKCGPRSLSQRS